jgi:hypothetical protein
MTITERHRIPVSLPPARLYLDDIEQIVRLFTQAADSENTETVFSVGKFDCTTIDDLKQLGRRSTNFKISVMASDSPVAELWIDKFRTVWYGGGLGSTDKCFRVYGQLQALFNVRRIRWKASLRSIPFLLTALLGLLVVAFKLKPKTPVPLGRNDLILFAILLPIAGWGWYKGSVEHSVVEFCQSHDAHGVQRRLAEWKPYIVGAIIAGVVKVVFDLIVQALKR